VHLAFIACQQCLWWQVGGVEFMSGQEETPGVVEERLSGSQRGGQGPVTVVDHPVRGGITRGASPCPIARPSVHRTGGAERRLQGLLEGSKRLACIRFTRTGGTASFLPGFACLITLLAHPCIDRALGLGPAAFGGDQDPALLPAAVNGGHLTIALVLGERCHGLGVTVGQGRLGVA
jgi:hypothetical protein